MLFTAFNGWKNIGKPDKPMMMAHFTKAADCKNPRGVYSQTALKNMLKNPPPAFEQSDRELIARALTEAHRFK